MSDWVKRKFCWLRMIAAEVHEWLPLAVAVELTGYFNSRSGEAWPSVETLAKSLHATPRGVRLALNKLVEAKLLGRQLGGQGPRDTSRYWMIDGFKGEVEFTLKRKKGEQWSPKRRNVSTKKGGPTVPPNTRKNTRGEPERDSALSNPNFEVRKKKGKGRSSIRSSRKTEFPEDWQLGNEDLAVAHRVAGWDLPQAEEQFDRFRVWKLDKGHTSANWPAAWERWCQTGRDHDVKQDALRETKASSTVVGIQKWLDRKKREKQR